MNTPEGSTASYTPATALSPLTLEIPPAPQLVVPVAQAKGVTLDTEFKFELPPQDFAQNIWLMGSWIVVQVTSKTSLKLPDLSSVGIVYDLGNDAGTWVLEAYGPTETPEGALALMDSTSPVINHSTTTFGRASRAFYLAK
jgi:hypothetical protein